MKEQLIKIIKRKLEYEKNKKLEQQQIEKTKKLEKQQIDEIEKQQMEDTNKQEEQSKENKKLKLKRKLFPFLKENYYFHF